MARTFKPTGEQRHLVKRMASCGIRQTDIATWVGLRSPKTLRKHFREEFDRGRIAGDSDVGKNLLKMAASGKRRAATNYYLNRQVSRSARLIPVAIPMAAPDFVITREQEAA